MILRTFAALSTRMTISLATLTLACEDLFIAPHAGKDADDDNALSKARNCLEVQTCLAHQVWVRRQEPAKTIEHQSLKYATRTKQGTRWEIAR